MTYLQKYIEKYPKEFNEAMSGTTMFGSEEMEAILKTALEQNKKFVIVIEKDLSICDGGTYKLIQRKSPRR
jgi:hypothetical protein